MGVRPETGRWVEHPPTIRSVIQRPTNHPCHRSFVIQNCAPGAHGISSRAGDVDVACSSSSILCARNACPVGWCRGLRSLTIPNPTAATGTRSCWASCNRCATRATTRVSGASTWTATTASSSTRRDGPSIRVIQRTGRNVAAASFGLELHQPNGPRDRTHGHRAQLGARAFRGGRRRQPSSLERETIL